MHSTPAGCVYALPCLLLLLLQVRVELSDEQRQLYKAILGRNYESLVGECGSTALRVWVSLWDQPA